jgi:hypothetical protein
MIHRDLGRLLPCGPKRLIRHLSPSAEGGGSDDLTVSDLTGISPPPVTGAAHGIESRPCGSIIVSCPGHREPAYHRLVYGQTESLAPACTSRGSWRACQRRFPFPTGRTANVSEPPYIQFSRYKEHAVQIEPYVLYIIIVSIDLFRKSIYNINANNIYFRFSDVFIFSV